MTGKKREVGTIKKSIYIQVIVIGEKKIDQYTSLEEDKTNELLPLLIPSKILVDFVNLKMDSGYKRKNDKNEYVCFVGRIIT